MRCIGTHNRAALTDELQDCVHGFQTTVTGVIPAHALDISRWCHNAGRLLHLDFQFYTEDLHLFEVGVAHGPTLLTKLTNARILLRSYALAVSNKNPNTIAVAKPFRATQAHQDLSVTF